MPHATPKFLNRIALVFDFDGTLAPDATDQLLKLAEVDPQRFKKEYEQPLEKQGWESLLARMYSLMQLAKNNEQVDMSREGFKALAKKLRLYEGVEEMFGKVRNWATAVVPGVEVEFYLLSSGFVDIYRHTSIAKEFNAMWGSEFAFDEEGKAFFVKGVITHPEKQRYLLQLAKGLGVDGANGPSNVYQPVPEEEWHIPLDQLIYLGDGLSDMPAFSLMNKDGGIALGVVDAEKIKDWKGYKQERRGRYVQNLVAADYSAKSELMQSLQLGVESICKVIALRKLSEGE